jgi:anti-sigma regulatory factor (Ser/Thr protein kinase)
MTSPDQSVNGPGRSSEIGVPEVVGVDQPFDEDALYSLRATVAAHAAAFGAPPVLVEKLVIVAGELATNAIRHAGGGGRLRLWRDHTIVHVQVSDRGPGLSDPYTGSTPPDQTATGGRGMWICRQLAQDLHIDTGRGGTTITALLDLNERDHDRGADAGPGSARPASGS